ncbi:hypothetical protein C367_04591 [Cryptococcus neoformans Ze90-1]|nr:hypothetical protein C367_04591 [Cryptococcus neoformans var. grubii Ze90-1]
MVIVPDLRKTTVMVLLSTVLVLCTIQTPRITYELPGDRCGRCHNKRLNCLEEEHLLPEQLVLSGSSAPSSASRSRQGATDSICIELSSPLRAPLKGCHHPCQLPMK